MLFRSSAASGSPKPRSGSDYRQLHRLSLAQPGKAAATNYLPLVMNYITATAIHRSTPTANLRSSVTERAMMTETENRELPIAAITAWVMLFFGSVSLSISYLATHTGLLAG
jgi:hypothetical protein